MMKKAARLTARMVMALNRKGMAPPMSRPMKTAGLSTWIQNSRSADSLMASPAWPPAMPAATFDRYEPYREMAAMTAEAMAMPLVAALVVLPTASRISTLGPPSAPDISVMPCALSATGP